MKMSCESCFFGELVEEDFGICRRYPPRITRPFDDYEEYDTNAEWPEIYILDWCGEYVEAPSE